MTGQPETDVTHAPRANVDVARSYGTVALVAPRLRSSRGRLFRAAAGLCLALGVVGVAARRRPVPTAALLNEQQQPETMAAMLETMCAAFGDPRIDWSACSAKEDQDGVSNYAQVAALYPAAAQCAVSDGATGFRWFRPCEWQAIANLPATCERAYEPQQPPAPPADASIGVVDKDAMAADLGLPVPGGATEPCQANAFCSACVAADGSTNGYCAAFLARHAALVKTDYIIGVPDVFFDELDYWCGADVLAGLAA
jgi:hypothetical protein